MLAGYLLAFATAWLFAASDVLIRGASRGLSPRENLLVTLIVGSPLLGILSLLLGEAPMSLEGLAVYSAIGVVHFYVGRLLFYTTVAGLGSASAAIIVSPTPLVASLMARIFLGEPLTLGHVAGLSLVSAAVYLAMASPSGRAIGVSSRRAALAGLGGILVFAATTVAVRWASQEYGSPLLGATASYIAALAVAALTVRAGSLGEGAYARYAVLGGVAVTLAQGSRYMALSMIPVADAVALISLFPISTVILASLAPWAEERIRFRHVAAGAGASLGVVFTILS